MMLYLPELPEGTPGDTPEGHTWDTPGGPPGAYSRDISGTYWAYLAVHLGTHLGAFLGTHLEIHLEAYLVAHLGAHLGAIVFDSKSKYLALMQ